MVDPEVHLQLPELVELEPDWEEPARMGTIYSQLPLVILTSARQAKDPVTVVGSGVVGSVSVCFASLGKIGLRIYR